MAFTSSNQAFSATTHRYQHGHNLSDVLEWNFTSQSYPEPARFDFTSVVVFATVAGVRGESANEIREGNLRIARQICQFGEKLASLDRVIFCSSMAVYGRNPKDVVISATTEPNPDTAYGESKLESEEMLIDFFGAKKLYIPRFPGLVGRGAVHSWLPSLVTSLLEGTTVEIQNPESKFNHVFHVGEAANLLSRLVVTDHEGFCAPIGPYPNLTIQATVNLLARNLNSNSQIKERAADRLATVIDYCAVPLPDRPHTSTFEALTRYSTDLKYRSLWPQSL